MHELLKLLRLLILILRDAIRDWWEDNAPRLAASIAFYTTFSLAPLVVVTIAIAGSIFGQAAVQGELVKNIEVLVGRDAAGVIQGIIKNARMSPSGGIATGVSVFLLLVGATAVFGELQHAINRVWQVRSADSLRRVAISRFLSFLMVLGMGVLLFASVVANAVLAILASYVGDAIPVIGHLLFVVNFLLPFALLTVLFAMFYKVLPDVKISWADVWVGALITSLLFVLGKYALGLYLGRGTVGSAYGAAGSFVVFLFWIYYSSQIFLFGAEVVFAYTRRLGIEIAPARGAVRLSEGEKECVAKGVD